MRALLPIGDVNERSRVTDYEGFGTVVEMRVVCVRPSLKNALVSKDTGHLIGKIDIDQAPSGMIQEKEGRNFTLDFDCSFAFALQGSETRWSADGWPINLCRTTYNQSIQGMNMTQIEDGMEDLLL